MADRFKKWLIDDCFPKCEAEEIVENCLIKNTSKVSTEKVLLHLKNDDYPVDEITEIIEYLTE